MIKGKMAGIAFGGLAGFMILNRAFTLIDNSIRNVCEANKWKNYYKYGKDGNVVAPGYSMHTHKIDDDHEVVVEDERQKQNAANTDGKDSGDKVAEAINKAVDTIFGKEKKEEDIPKDTFSDEEHQAVEESTSGEKDPLYVESLEDGLKAVDTDGDDADIFNVEIDGSETNGEV